MNYKCSLISIYSESVACMTMINCEIGEPTTHLGYLWMQLADDYVDCCKNMALGRMCLQISNGHWGRFSLYAFGHWILGSFFKDLFLISNLGDLCSFCHRHSCTVLIWRQTLKEWVSNTTENLSYSCTKNWVLASMSSHSTALIYNGREGKIRGQDTSLKHEGIE